MPKFRWRGPILQLCTHYLQCSQAQLFSARTSWGGEKFPEDKRNAWPFRNGLLVVLKRSWKAKGCQIWHTFERYSIFLLLFGVMAALISDLSFEMTIAFIELLLAIPQAFFYKGRGCVSAKWELRQVFTIQQLQSFYGANFKLSDPKLDAKFFCQLRSLHKRKKPW